MATTKRTVGFLVRAYLAGRMLFAGADLAADAAKVWLAASPAGPAGGPLAMIRASEAWGHGALLGFLVVAYLGADGLIALAGRAADPAGDGRAEPLRLGLACFGLWMALAASAQAVEMAVSSGLIRHADLGRFNFPGWERLASPLVRLPGGLLILAYPALFERLFAGSPDPAAPRAAGVEPAAGAAPLADAKAAAPGASAMALPASMPPVPAAGPDGTQEDGTGRRAALALLLMMAVGGAALAILVLRTKKFVEVPLTASVDLRAASQGPGTGQLNSPRGLAVAPDGSLYVADCQNSRIDVFSPEGVFKKSFGAAAAKAGEGKPGEFSEPSGVAVAPNGVVYVADTWNQRVQKFSADGDYLGQYQGAPYNFYSPRNVATDSAGNLYVADTGHSMVKAFSADGKPLAELGGRGPGEGQFSEVFGVAVDSQGEIFAADPGNGRLHKFGPLPNAGLLKEVDVPGWRAAPPFWPQVAINAADEVFVTDNRGHRIWVYDSGLVYRGSIVCGQDPGPSPALGAAFSKDGKLWISDMGRGMLLRLTGFDPLPARP